MAAERNVAGGMGAQDDVRLRFHALPASRLSNIRDGLIVNFPDVFYAMQLLLLLASGNHGFEGLEGVPVTFFGGLNITPVPVATPQNGSRRARGISTRRRATQALGLNI